MKQRLISLLQKTLLPNADNIRQATAQLQIERQKPGFYLALMELSDDQQVAPILRQCALANFKVTIEKRWVFDSKWKVDSYIPEEQKSQIQQNLMRAVIRCNRERKFMKIWKEIIKHIIMVDCEKWLPLEEIVEGLSSNSNIECVLHFLLAVVDGLELPINKNEIQLEKLILQVFPHLFSLVTRFRNPETLYLTCKTIWKGFHMELKPGSRIQCLRWIPFVLDIINSNAQVAGRELSFQRESPEFYYFHSKKWACRIVYRFAQRHANFKYCKRNQPFSHEFYKIFGSKIVETLISQIHMPNIPKGRYFILKSLTVIVQTRPTFFNSQVVNDLLYNKLPPYLKLRPEDEKLAKEDPIELLKSQLDPLQNFTNIKRASMDLWLSLIDLGSKPNNPSDYTCGPYFINSMKFLRSCLQSTDLLQKQMGMYMMCQARISVLKVNESRKILPQLVVQYIIPQFKNPIMLVRARAVELFSHYGKAKFTSPEILTTIVEGIYNCLANDPEKLVNIKAAGAFSCLLSHQQAVMLVRPHLDKILQIYLRLLDSCELEEVVQSLDEIIKHFSSQIGPYAVGLIKQVCRIYSKYCLIQERETPNGDYESQTEIAATACLQALDKIVDSPISPQALLSCEPYIISVVAYGFTAEGQDFLQNSLNVLASYLNKMTTVSMQLLFFYPIMIYYILGLNEQQLAASKNFPKVNQLQQRIFKNLHKSHITELTYAVPSIRMFVVKSTNTILTQNDFYNTPFYKLLFILADRIYKASAVEADDIECEKANITCLMVHLLECVPPNPQLTLMIWQIFKANLQNDDELPSYLRIINCQLASLCLYVCPDMILQKMAQEGIVENWLKLVREVSKKIKAEQECQRMLLGISVLFAHQIPTGISNSLEFFFKFASKIIGSIARMRQEKSEIESEETGSESEQSEDDDYLWDEQRNIHYESPLQKVDQVIVFEQSIKILEQSDKSVYQRVIHTLPQQKLQILEQDIKTAKQQFVRQTAQLN